MAIFCIIMASATVEDGTDAHDSMDLEAASLDSGGGDAPGLQGKVGRGRIPEGHPAGHVGRANRYQHRRHGPSDEAASLFQQALHQEIAAGHETSRDVIEAQNRVICRDSLAPTTLQCR